MLSKVIILPQQKNKPYHDVTELCTVKYGLNHNLFFRVWVWWNTESSWQDFVQTVYQSPDNSICTSLPWWIHVSE